MKSNPTKNLIERFSCSLVGRGKKIVGHKILLESLSLLREKNKKIFLSVDAQKNQLRKTKNDLLVFTPLRSKKKIITSVTPSFTFDERTRISVPRRESKYKSTICKEICDLQPFGFLQNQSTEITSSLSLEMKKISSSLYTKKNQLLPRNKIMYDAYKSSICKDKLADFFTENNNLVCQLCVDKVKVLLETRKVRKGRITYRVPIISSPRRQEGKAISLLIENANSRDPKSSSPKANVTSSNSKRVDEGSFSLLSKISRLDLSCFRLVNRKSQPANQKVTMCSRETGEKFVRADTIQQQNDNCIAKKQRKNLLLPKSNLKLRFRCEDKEQITQSERLKKKSWFLDNYSNSRFFYSIKNSLAEEFFESINGKSASVEKKKQLHAFALQNRASLHFRWW